MKCYKCGRDVQLTYYLPPDGIRFYCTYCWNQIIGELERENRESFTNKAEESSR